MDAILMLFMWVLGYSLMKAGWNTDPRFDPPWIMPTCLVLGALCIIVGTAAIF